MSDGTSEAFGAYGTTQSSDTPRQMTPVWFPTRVGKSPQHHPRPLDDLTDDLPDEVVDGLTDDTSETGTMSTNHATETDSLPERPLSDRDLEILAFERQWWKYAGSKEQAIKELFDMSSTRYYQVLNALLDNPAALEADPMLIKRLRRMRASRQRARTSRRLGINT
jgi:hypothetical protein